MCKIPNAHTHKKRMNENGENWKYYAESNWKLKKNKKDGWMMWLLLHDVLNTRASKI